MRSRPLVGVSTYLEEARWSVWSVPAAVLHQSYVVSVQRAGGIPLLLPPGAEDAAAVARDVVGSLDALIVSGGADVNPALYGVEPHSATGRPRTDRDRWESALIEAALDADLPLLAICRGMQLLNVVLGGTLHQHLPEIVGNQDHAPAPGHLGSPGVKILPGSALERTLDGEVTVACHHHQAIDKPGEGVTPVAWAEDGTIEAIELPDHPYVTAVQWHPEETDDLRLFHHLTSQAKSLA